MSRTKDFYHEQLLSVKQVVTEAFDKAEQTLDIKDVFKELSDTPEGRLFLGELLVHVFDRIEENPSEALTCEVREIRLLAKFLNKHKREK